MPGSLIDWDKRPDPCIPTPIMPKRTGSPAGTASGTGMRRWGIGPIVCAANDAPAAAALMPKNSRREQLFSFTGSPRSRGLIGNRTGLASTYYDRGAHGPIDWGLLAS